MADIGHVALILALVASIYSMFAYILGRKGTNPALAKSARNGLFAALGLVSLSVIILTIALITYDFEFKYVASYTDLELSLLYRISALWGGQAGSLLFWAWFISLFSVMAALWKRDAIQKLQPYALAVIMVVQVFFLSLLVSVSTPFSKLFPVPVDGAGMNLLLQHPGMLLHAPITLIAFAAFTIPFAYAIAALLSRKLGNEWLVSIRRWTVLAWLLLGVGNILGAWWAYTILGWGGYWAWDPVENAGLMPWLFTTAFLHFSLIQKRRHIFKIWNLLFIILTFNLIIFGTYIARSGILASVSVHVFGDHGLDPFFLTFFCITLLGSIALLFYRRNDLRDETTSIQLVSRESTFYLTGLLLAGSALIVLIGTIFPAITRAIAGNEIVIDAGFFDRVVGPIFLVIVLVIGICVQIGWQRAIDNKSLINRFLWPLVAAIVIIAILFIAGIREWIVLTAYFVCGFTFFSILFKWFQEIKVRNQAKVESYLKAFWKLLLGNRPHYGGYIIHLSIVIIAVGVIGSSFYESHKQSLLETGESVTISGYTLTFNGVTYEETPNLFVAAAQITVYQGDRYLGELAPQKRIVLKNGQSVSDPAIRTSLVKDLYVILDAWSEDGGTILLTVRNEPLVIWLWIGGYIFILGGLIALWPGDRRQSTLQRPQAVGLKKE
ncbi:MAG: cytochrome c-type biogenesis CcmF C-terminal domain-containing protein [Dehalococcoidales bacterium]|nr:cytochrome c-type biogenesis CcmF C-terminal domain-containing protein [Dehalococcoidales bacterium]